MHGAGAQTRLRRPGHWRRQGEVDLAYPCAVTETPKSTPVPRRQAVAGEFEQRPRCDIEQYRTRRRQLIERRDPLIGEDRATCIFDSSHHRRYQVAGSALDNRPADGVSESGQQQCDSAARWAAQLQHRVRGNASEQAAGFVGAKVPCHDGRRLQRREPEPGDAQRVPRWTPQVREHGVDDVIGVAHRACAPTAIRGRVGAQRVSSLVDRAHYIARAAAVEWVRELHLGLEYPDTARLQVEAAKER